jgi:hypothetical protein
MVQHFKFLIQDALSNISNQDVKSFISAQETEEDSEDDPCTWSLSKYSYELEQSNANYV